MDGFSRLSFFPQEGFGFKSVLIGWNIGVEAGSEIYVASDNCTDLCRRKNDRRECICAAGKQDDYGTLGLLIIPASSPSTHNTIEGIKREEKELSVKLPWSSDATDPRGFAGC